MSKTIVQIIALNKTKESLWEMEIQVMNSDMTKEEASKALREARQYELVEVFDRETNEVLPQDRHFTQEQRDIIYGRKEGTWED